MYIPADSAIPMHVSASRREGGNARRSCHYLQLHQVPQIHGITGKNIRITSA